MRLRLREARVKDIGEAELLAVQLEAFRMADRQRTHRVHAVGQPKDQNLSGHGHEQTKLNDAVKGLRQDMQLLTRHLQRLSTSNVQSERDRIHDYQNNIYQRGDFYSWREWPGRGNQSPIQSQDRRHDINIKQGNGQTKSFRGQTSTRTGTNQVSIRASKYGDEGLFVPTLIVGLPVTMPVDTGANITLLNREVLDKLTKKSSSIKLLPVNLSMVKRTLK
ncbi:hypothetical protein SNE40_016410 [Patella caerulea]|uniref:Peptidase A2 domain-containing protein n=1 Tax=Patella caerulea TaxID=87958 RepID=A0AAN8PD77_PATCE